jgi:hypothetical protein
MSSLQNKLNTLQKQYGGSGIPFSEFMKQKRKSKKKTTVRKKSSRSPSRKRKVTRRTKKRKRKAKSKTKHKHNKKCKCGSHTYTSKENTPRGLGKCEECIPLNVIMKGKDGYLYENKNHQWIKFN